jgi:hypothetical protein
MSDEDLTFLDDYIKANKSFDPINSKSGGKNTRFPNIRNAAFALAGRPPIEHVVKNVIERGSNNLWFGKYGSKKTWVVTYLAVCVAAKKSYLGMEVNGGPVLYVDEENGEDRISNRFAMCIRGALVTADIPLYYISLAQVNFLKKPNDAVLLAALIKELGAVLVVFDSLSDIMAGGDENAVKDTQPVFMALRKIAESTKAAVITLHHTGKNDDYRGSSAIPGALDDMIRITSEVSSPYIQFRSEKKRNGLPIEFAACATWTDEQFYLSEADMPANKEHLSKSQRFIMDQFESCDQVTIDMAIDTSGDLYSESAIRKAFQDVAAKGLITRIDGGGRGAKAVFRKS